MNCYRCGAKLTNNRYCPNCNEDVSIYKKIICTSNVYYNQGLEKTKVRDLSGAIESLKRSLYFYKENTVARNLLGLIYYEMGDVVAALSEWVISKSLQPNENVAEIYLNDIQQNASALERVNQTIKKYNQALNYCEQGSYDLAMIQLKKVLNMNDKFLKAHQLLALLYIKNGEFDKAKVSLRNAGRIDVNNTTTLRYLKEVNSMLYDANKGKRKKSKNSVSYQNGNDTIIQPVGTYKESTGLGTAVNVGIGILIGAMIVYFLVVPGVKSAINASAQSSITDANEQLSSKDATINSLNSQIDDLNSQISDYEASASADSSVGDNYHQLLNAYVSWKDGDNDTALTAFSSIDTSKLDEDAMSIYNEMSADLNSAQLTSLYDTAYSAYEQEDYATAIDNFTQITAIDETYKDGNTLYYLAQSYRKNNQTDEAIATYQKIIDQYPNTSRATKSQEYIDELQAE